MRKNRPVFRLYQKGDIKMALTSNKSVLKWVDEMVALTKPDKVVWIDGSEEQLEALRRGLLHRRDDQAE